MLCPLCTPILAGAYIKFKKLYIQQNSQNQLLKERGKKATGVVKAIKVTNSSSYSNRSDDGSADAFQAVVTYYDCFKKNDVCATTPNLLNPPKKGDRCHVYYDDQGHFYVNFLND